MINEAEFLGKDREEELDFLWVMRTSMTEVLQMLSVAINKNLGREKLAFPASDFSPESLRQDVKDLVVSKRVADSAKWRPDENNFYVWLPIAEMMDLALLAPAFPAARIALLQFADCEEEIFRRPAVLALLACDFQHPNLAQIQLDDWIQWEILFKLPFKMYQKIFPQLDTVFLKSPGSIDLLLSAYDGPRSFVRERYKEEIEGFFVRQGIFSSAIMYKMISTKKYETIAFMITSNEKAMEYFLQLCKNSDWAGGVYDEIDDLLTSLEFVDPDRIPSDFPQKIISLVDPLFKMMPKLCSKVYHCLVRIGNYDNYRSEIQQYLLSKMCSDEKTHTWIILECLIDMKNPCPELKQEVQNLMNWTGEKWIGAHLREESAKVAAAWGL